MQSIEIEFCHPRKREETFTLSWDVLEHDAAFFWFNLFCRELRTQKEYFSRFTGFVGGEKGIDYLLNSLNRCIEIINQDGRYEIKERATHFDQEFSNIIHHHFELLIGDRDNQTELYKDSSPQVFKAIHGLNFFIHDLEAYTRNLEAQKKGEDHNSFSGVIVEVLPCERFRIPASFEKYFTMDLSFGDLVAHYSQVGKTWLEAFYDNDQEIFPEAIRPLYAFSGEFDIMFGNFRPDKNFQNKLNKFLEGKKQNPHSRALRLGHLPLAKFKWNQSKDERFYKEKLAYYDDIKRITAFSDGKIVAERSLMNTTSVF